LNLDNLPGIPNPESGSEPETNADASVLTTEPCPACGASLDISGAGIYAARSCPACNAQIYVHRTVGHYAIQEIAGDGGQGTVYKALDANLNRPVALKVLHSEHSDDPEFIQKFEYEAQLTASINHPNVVRVLSSGQEGASMYLVMELVDNGSLDSVMNKLGKVPEARVLQIGIQIAEGLKAGYEQGLIHRDVKPGNILFAGDGSAKVVDFGLAIFAEQDAAEGEIWGTPYYLSPERLQRQPEDFRSDIYSLGATLFHALAGRPPFEAEDASHVALKHLTTHAASIQSYAPNVTNNTAYVINRTLAKSPDERYASYDEFIEHLTFARTEAMKRASHPELPKDRLVMEDANQQRWLSLITISAIVLLLAGGIAAFFILKKPTRDRSGAQNEEAAEASGVFSSFGPGWVDAQKLLLQNQGTLANRAFAKLVGSAQKQPNSTIYVWAVVHQSFGLLLNGKDAEAGAVLQTLSELAKGSPSKAQRIAAFYVRVGERLISHDPVNVDIADSVNPKNHEALALLFYAIKNWDEKKADEATTLFKEFESITPEQEYAWINDYKKIVGFYIGG